MRSRRHGSAISQEQWNIIPASDRGLETNETLTLATAPQFNFLFSTLQNDETHLLPASSATREALVNLGHTMRAVDTAASNDSALPAAYTYFGQFVSHDITFEELSAPLPNLLNVDLAPLPPETILTTLRNSRSGALDLDSVYDAPAPRVGEELELGMVTVRNLDQKPFLRPVGKDILHDLPRETSSNNAGADRSVALIGDRRNDENLVIQQLHVAFLRAHKALITRGNDFETARKLLRQHYQHIILHDYLPRVADPLIVQQELENQLALTEDAPLSIPLEFTVAAFRFGHCQVRAEYDFNLNFNRSGETGTELCPLGRLFSFTAFSGELGGFDTLPEHWIIEWERFVDVGQPFNRARRIGPSLVEPLFHLPNLRGIPEQADGARLAVRNLLRGYLLRMPTGQAVASTLGLPALTPSEMEAAAASPEQFQVLQSSGFLARTPLWYYVLVEAAARADGQHLGPVGSTIIARVLIGLIRRSAGSILQIPDWTPTLPSAQAGKFTLTDLLRLAGALT